MIEIRWHGRAGQGAKTVSHLLAVAMLESGEWVQAFPDYGPERSGAPMRAYNRSDTAPIRRRSAVTRPDVVVVLDESLLEEEDVTAGLGPSGVLIVNSESSVDELAARLRWRGRVLCIPADRLAAAAGARRSNVVLLGALARLLGRPSREALERAVVETMDAARFATVRDATLSALVAGYEAGATEPVEAGGTAPVAARRTATLKRTGDLPIGGVMVRDFAPSLLTGGWRSGLEPVLDLSRCVNCLLCWIACPDCAFALERAGDDVRLGAIEYALCKGCELCVEVCPVAAIEMVAEGTHLLPRPAMVQAAS